MQVPWFFATTSAPQPAAPEQRRRRARWWPRLAQHYIDWAVRSHARLRDRAAGR